MMGKREQKIADMGYTMDFQNDVMTRLEVIRNILMELREKNGNSKN